MLRKSILILIGILLISCSKDSETRYSVDAKKVFLQITEKTTKSELTKIALEFKQKKNISIDFSKSEFNQSGFIEKLHLEIDCNDGFKGIAKSSGSILKLKNSGFYRDYTEKSKTPFLVGAM